MFANNNFISYFKGNFTVIWYKFRKYTILCVLPPILSEKLTALKLQAQTAKRRLGCVAC